MSTVASDQYIAVVVNGGGRYGPVLLWQADRIRQYQIAGAHADDLDPDLRAKTLKVTDTKNHLDHTLPLSDFLYKLLQQRKNSAVNEYVFQRASGIGRITEQRKQMAKVIEESGVSFTIHDLRRTFMTVAERLDISAYAVKRLVNHKMNNDVTAGYIIADVERLRVPMQRITDYLLNCAGID